MPAFSLSAQLTSLALLLLLSGMFSMTETVMMATNRYRLRSLAAQGDRRAQMAVDLLAKTDRLLGVILLFNNLINTAAATLASVITIQLFGEERWALAAGTVIVAFLLLVFAEITPKVMGARHADRLSLLVAYPLNVLLRVFYPAVWFVNLFVSGLLRVLRLQPQGQEPSTSLSAEELRSMVLESSHFIPNKHRSILVNLFDLEAITVEDVMIPRGAIESIKLADPLDLIRHQLATSYHTRLPLFADDGEHVIGVLHLRRVLAHALGDTFDHDSLRQLASKPYFVPADTPLYSQLQFFQENHQRLALVVDEYGELLGLITLEDIVEELIGKFTTSLPDNSERIGWDTEGSVTVDGSHNLRTLNRKLGLKLPTDGPKTLNGLILEQLQEIPESEVSLRVAGIAIEVVQTQDRRVRTVKIFRPEESPSASG